MIKTTKYNTIDKIALRQKGWMWFATVIGLQMIFVMFIFLIK
ncbi:KGW motif small protein [Acinetobacter stercoris]|uniref:Uncharacterized protein n=1 Tax=Acinetobacter stercoris TaxID=2126983 RepID=A0A2U3MYI4_9GAMM|nr:MULTISPECIES: KGW motif small protein [Acinetobacter]SPL70498.1 hypothetical protein KPC_1676 [Acinetobacter stercoris]